MRGSDSCLITWQLLNHFWIRFSFYYLCYTYYYDIEQWLMESKNRRRKWHPLLSEYDANMAPRLAFPQLFVHLRCVCETVATSQGEISDVFTWVIYPTNSEAVASSQKERTFWATGDNHCDEDARRLRYIASLLSFRTIDPCFLMLYLPEVIQRPYDLIWIYPDCVCNDGSKDGIFWSISRALSHTYPWPDEFLSLRRPCLFLVSFEISLIWACMWGDYLYNCDVTSWNKPVCLLYTSSEVIWCPY